MTSLMFLSCAQDKILLIWSDKSEMADIVELYNMSDSEYRAIFQYKEELISSFINEEEKPDIIIGDDLANSLIKEEMSSLDAYNFQEHIIDLFEKGTFLDGESRVLPLAYNPPIMLFPKESKRINHGLPALPLETVRELSQSFNEEKKRGYSPYWDEDFLIVLLDLFGLDLTIDASGSMIWSEENLEKALSFLNQWHEANNEDGSIELFNLKYLYENRLKILKDEKILFTATDLGDFMSLSDKLSGDLHFHYLSREKQIHSGNIVYGAIYNKTDHHDIAGHFLDWLVQPATQNKIIQSSLRNKTGSFGLLGGLSTVKNVNVEIFPLYYPILEGKVPDPAFLTAPGEKPADYDSVKYDLLTPWLEDRMKGDGITLREAVDKWDRLRIPF